jgi:hypothetical protein
VSFSTKRRDALDQSLPLPHRMSSARSCAMLMGQKYKVRRSAILDLVHRMCGVDLMTPASESELVAAVHVLDRIKAEGMFFPAANPSSSGATI